MKCQRFYRLVSEHCFKTETPPFYRLPESRKKKTTQRCFCHFTASLAVIALIRRRGCRHKKYLESIPRELCVYLTRQNTYTVSRYFSNSTRRIRIIMKSFHTYVYECRFIRVRMYTRSGKLQYGKLAYNAASSNVKFAI